MTLLDLRESVRLTLASAVPGLVKVQTHGGRFDIDALRNYTTLAPCAVVSVLDMPAVTLEGSQLVGDVSWGVFIITKDVGVTKRDALALALVEACFTTIRPGQTWGSSDTHAAEKLKASNLFSTKIDGMGIALWAVTWRQKLDLVTFDFSTLDDFLTYNVKYDLEESADEAYEAEDTVTLEGPED